MKLFLRNLVFVCVFFGVIACTPEVKKDVTQEVILTDLEKSELELIEYDVPTSSKVMVLGTFHFRNREDILEKESQEYISKLLNVLTKYKPTKIVLEWEPSFSDQTNKAYQSFLADSFDISTKTNETYQLGFRLAKQMKHDSLYLFDNQTEFEGSLKGFSSEDDPFSFTLFTQYAKDNDEGFFNKYEKTLVETFN